MKKGLKLSALTLALAGTVALPLIASAGHKHSGKRHGTFVRKGEFVSKMPAPCRCDLNANHMSVWSALENGCAKMYFRMRYENVDQGVFVNDSANALTLLSQATYQSARYYDFNMFLQLYNVSNIGNMGHFDSVNMANQNMYPQITDPRGGDFSQAYLQYRGLQDTSIKVGRQLISFNNERMVGPVAFRQNWQSFDAVSVTNTSLPDTSIYYAYANRVNRTVGPQGAESSPRINAHLFNAVYKGLGFVNVSPYALWLDYDSNLSTAMTMNSTFTWGARADGNYKIDNDFAVSYAAEYAHQADKSHNPVDFSAWYMDYELGASWQNMVGIEGRYELLSGDQSFNTAATSHAFRTPLGTNFAQNGWADLFLTTPYDGLADWNVGGWVKMPQLMNVKLMARYHNFTAEDGSADFGTEWDFKASKAINKNLAVSARYAAFSTDNTARFSDKNVFWLTAVVKFDILKG